MELCDLEIWCYDCEVFAHDWIFVFESPGGEKTHFWNDPESLALFVDENEGSLFAGYNSSRYDQYILKAVLAGCDPEQVKEVNDWIIAGNTPWEHAYLADFYFRFNDVDLMKDVQMGTSLKSIEGHASMSVEESSVPFDIDRPLTAEERADVLEYCEHDVDAARVLLGMRGDYLSTKLALAERAGLAPERALALTNAKLTAAVLRASQVPHDDERAYAVPANLRTELIPDEVIEFFARVGDEEIPDEELWSMKLEIEVGGCPVTLGFGGIHGALPRYREVAG